MKKLFILFVSFIFLCLPAFAEYKPIPDNLKEQYKNEVEQTIKIEFNNRYNNVKNYDKQILATSTESRYSAIDIGLQAELFYFFMDLLNITNKYVNIKEDIPVTDFWFPLQEILSPYLKDNSINTKLIDKLIQYTDKKEKELRKKFLTEKDYLKDFAYLDDRYCYNIKSFHYNKFTNTYAIDMIVDITELHPKYYYTYPYNKGYITHLIFRTKLHNNKFHVKYKGFVAYDIITEYNNNKKKDIHYNNIIEISTAKPQIIKNDIKELEYTFINWINIDSYRKTVKSLVNT